MTFPSPSFEYQEEIDRDTLQTQFPEFRAVANRTEKVLRVFHLQYKNVLYSSYFSLYLEFANSYGQAVPTLFTPVDEGTPVAVRFLSDDFRAVWTTPTTFDLNIDLIEDPK